MKGVQRAGGIRSTLNLGTGETQVASFAPVTSPPGRKSTHCVYKMLGSPRTGQNVIVMALVHCRKPHLGYPTRGQSLHSHIFSKSYPCNRPWRPIWLWDVEAPIFCLDSRLTDGSEVVSLTRRPPFTPQEDSWYSLLSEAESTPGPHCGWKD
jgi:hypothetical protein